MIYHNYQPVKKLVHGVVCDTVDIIHEGDLLLQGDEQELVT